MCLHILKRLFILLPPTDDFESKFNFHPIEDLPPPEEYRPINKVYPSKTNTGMSNTMKHIALSLHLTCFVRNNKTLHSHGEYSVIVRHGHFIYPDLMC